MEEKLEKLYLECTCELKTIGIDVLNSNDIGEIYIGVSKRNNKRYGACRQVKPDKNTMYTEKIGRRKLIKYWKYNEHYIEVSPWVMELDDSIIKNTIMHEIIHCMPYCNNHGEVFKKYAKYINSKLGYDISRTGNKRADYDKSNIKYEEEKKYNYKIECTKCGQVILRQRYNRNFTKKYRCGICGGKFNIYKIEGDYYG